MEIDSFKEKHAKEQEIQYNYLSHGAQFFLNKLYDILSNLELTHIICWAGDGDRFNILNPRKLQDEILPSYFKHKNLKSFVRQLNLHGFKKIRVGARITESTIDSYRHTHFRQNRPDLVSQIKRKIAKPLTMEEAVTQLPPIYQSPEPEANASEREPENKEVQGFGDSTNKFQAACQANKFGKVILKGLRVFNQRKAKIGELCKVSPADNYVYELTQDYISNIYRYCRGLSTTTLLAPTESELHETSLLGKRDLSPSYLELAAFKHYYKERNKAQDSQQGHAFPHYCNSPEHIKYRSFLSPPLQMPSEGRDRWNL